MLLSLGIGVTATEVAGKYILKDAKGAALGEMEIDDHPIKPTSPEAAIKLLRFDSRDDFKIYVQAIGKDTSLTNKEKVLYIRQAFDKVADKTDICIPSDAKYIKGFTADGQIQYDWPGNMGFDKTTISSVS